MEANKRDVCKQKQVLLMMFGLFLADVIFHIHAYVSLSFHYAIEHTLPMEELKTLSDVGNLSMKISLYKCTNMTAEYRLTWLILRTFLVHFGPSMVLIIFTIFLVFALNRISKKRKSLLNNKSARKLSYILANQKSTEVNDHELKGLTGTNIVNKKIQIPSESSDPISKMMIVVLILFLIGEIPTTIQITIYTVNFLMGKPTMLQEFRSVANAFLVMTYPANFFIYCIMSTNFREALRSCFLSRSKCTQSSNI